MLSNFWGPLLSLCLKPASADHDETSSGKAQIARKARYCEDLQHRSGRSGGRKMPYHDSISGSLYATCQGILLTGIRYQVSGIRYQVSGIRYQVSGIRYQVSGIRYQVSGIRYQVSGIFHVHMIGTWLSFVQLLTGFPGQIRIQDITSCDTALSGSLLSIFAEAGFVHDSRIDPNNFLP